MKDRKSIASALIFAGSALCFFLPFVTVSCGGMKAFTLTGQQLATGTTLTQPQPFGSPQTQKIDGDPFAALAGICTLAGIALSLIGRKMVGPSAASGAAAAISLLILRSRLDGQIQKQGEGMASVNFETGYTLALLLLIAGTAWNVYLFLQGRQVKEAEIPDHAGGNLATVPEASAGSPPQVPVPVHGPPAGQSQEQSTSPIGQIGTRFCTQCGQAIKTAARFCERCGSSADAAKGNAEIQTPTSGGKS